MRTKPSKYNYHNRVFYDQVECFARQGYTDKEIAQTLHLSPGTFRMMKHERNKDGSPTNRSNKIIAALSRGRVKINQAVRSIYLSLALGNLKFRKQTTRKVLRVDEDFTEVEITTIANVLPNRQAISTWLFNHDEEWRANVIAIKREVADAGTGNNIPAEVNIRIVYNQVSDLELQKK